MKPENEDWLSGPTPGQIDPKELAEIEKMDEEQKPKDEPLEQAAPLKFTEPPLVTKG